MRQKIAHGAMLDTVTPAEMRAVMADFRPPGISRIRVTETVQLDANGSGTDDVYVVPPGYEMIVRRVMMNLDTAADPSTGNVLLNVSGKYVAYLRSGTLISYSVPKSVGNIPQVPGVETWSAEEGPYLRNGEAFEVRVQGLTANAKLLVFVQGVLFRPGSYQSA
jgi:hypothetical protein